MNLSDLTLLERITVRAALVIYYALAFALVLTFLFLLADGMIDYLTLGKYDISSF